MRKLLPIAALLLASLAAGSGCDQKFPDGQFLYKQICANCHMDDGSGLGLLIPPLAGADFLRDHQAELPCIIHRGLSGKITVNGKEYGGQEMAGLPTLTDVEITNICNYVNTSFGNAGRVVSLQEVQRALANCPK